MEFSVLMSVYYKEKAEYLEESLNSIINQTFMPNEVVIVKDGKIGEDLQKIINKYNEDYPNLFNILEFETNQGLGKALRYGVENAKNNIIARMDSDDIAVPNRFEKQIKLMLKDRKLDMVGSNIAEFDKNIKDIVSIRRVPTTNEEIKVYSKKRNPFNHMTVMYKKDAVINAGNYIDFLWNEDYYLWVRMIINKCRMANIDEELVYARAGSSMFERRGGIKYALMDIRLQMEYYKLGFINTYQFICNVITRVSIRVLPNRLRQFIYINLLRK